MLALMQLAAAMNGVGKEQDPADEGNRDPIPEGPEGIAEKQPEGDTGSAVDGAGSEEAAYSLGAGSADGSGSLEATTETEVNGGNSLDAGSQIQSNGEAADITDDCTDVTEPSEEIERKQPKLIDLTDEAELFVKLDNSGDITEIKYPELFAEFKEPEISEGNIIPKIPVTPVIRSYSILKDGQFGLVAVDGERVIPITQELSVASQTSVPSEGSSVDKPEVVEGSEEIVSGRKSVDEGSSVDIDVEEINVTFDQEDGVSRKFGKEKDVNLTEVSGTASQHEDEGDSKPDIDLSSSVDGGPATEKVSDLTEDLSDVIQSTICEVVSNNVSTPVESDVINPHEDLQINGYTRSVTPDQKLKMPEKMDEEDALPPTLQNAVCRYRWAKSLPTTTADVMFFCSVRMEQPVKLSWTEGSECYYSEEYEIPSGVYKGNLVVDGRTYAVEDLTIKHYTFEVDIYVKDDVIDDESDSDLLADRNAASPYRSSEDINTSRDAITDRYDNRESEAQSDPIIHISNKYEELIRQQLSMTESIESMNREAKMATNSDHHGDDDFTFAGRQSPLGDNATESFQDGGANNYDSAPNDQLNTLKRTLDVSVIEDEVERSSLPHSHHSPVHGSTGGLYEALDTQGHQAKSPGSPSRQTPDNVYSEDGRSPRKSSEHSVNGSGKHTPVDDIINDFFTDQRSGFVHSHTSPTRHTTQEDEKAIKDVLSRQITPTRSPAHSYHGSDRQTIDFVGDVLGQSTPVARSEQSGSQQGSARQSPVRSAHSSQRQTPQQVDDVISTRNQDILNGSYHSSASGSPAPASYHGSVTGSPAPASYHGSVTGSPAPASYHGSATGSPAPASYHGSATGSPVPASYHGSATGSPAPASFHGSGSGSAAPGSYHVTGVAGPGSYHVTGVAGPGNYQGSLRGSQEQESVHESAAGSPAPGSYHGSGGQGQGSYHGSHGSGSRPQSLTSEQELSQYFSDRSDARRTPTSQVPSNASSGVRPGSEMGERSANAASLPVLSTQQRIQAEKRSMTPDNHIRVPGSPGVRISPLVTGSAPRSAASSRSSTRTITPTTGANGYHVNGEQEDIHTRRIQELEDTVRNLRKLLGSREMEVKELTSQVSDLTEMNASVKEELELARNRAAPGSRGNLAEWERKYGQLLDEKEIMAVEVVKLRDRLLQLETEQAETMEGENMGLSKYSPNNPYALQRKIEDLHSQVQDLQEANEAAVSELSEVEKKCKDVETENEKLSALRNTSMSDLQAENRRLHDKISTLWDQGYGDGDRRLRVEVQQFKDDNRALKERNYKLHEENLALREEVSQIRKVLEGASPKPEMPKLRYADDRLSQSEINLRYADDRLGQSENSKLRYSEDRLSQSERLPPPKEKLLNRDDIDVTYRRVTEKETESRFRGSYEKDERYRRSLDKVDGLKSSLKKDDRFASGSYRLEKEERYQSNVDKEDKYRSTLDKDEYKLYNSVDGKFNGYSQHKSSSHQDESKYRYDTSDRLTQYELSRDKSRSDRGFDQDYTERSRSDGYRSRPDGGSASVEKDILAPSLTHYDKQTTPEKSSYLMSREKSDQREKSLKDIYSAEGQKYSGQEYRSLTASYSELLKLTQQNSLGDKREWSRSEANLHARGHLETDLHGQPRGRSREISERRHSGSIPRVRATSPPPQTRQHHNLRPRSAQLQRPLYGWDDDLHRRTNSERPDATAVLTTTYTRPDIGPPPPYRSKDSYDRRDADRDYAVLRKSTTNTYAEEKADDSDTGTDILVNAQPFEKQIAPPSPQRSELHRRHHSTRHRRRRGHDSVGSDGSDSSLDDAEEQITTLRRRSKSADGRDLLRRSAPPGGLSRGYPPPPTRSVERPTFSKTCPLPSPAGFRSVTPGVLATQHNKHSLSASTSDITATSNDNLLFDEAYIELLKCAFGVDHEKMPAPGSLVTLTTGLRPFAPRTPGDIHMDDVVKFSRQGGKLSQGTVKFVGHLPGRNDVYLGVELDKEEGKHDGTFEKVRYFKCKPNKGVFVAFNKVVMAWAP